MTMVEVFHRIVINFINTFCSNVHMRLFYENRISDMSQTSFMCDMTERIDISMFFFLEWQPSLPFISMYGA